MEQLLWRICYDDWERKLLKFSINLTFCDIFTYEFGLSFDNIKVIIHDTGVVQWVSFDTP